jgi:hypothetical protein
MSEQEIAASYTDRALDAAYQQLKRSGQWVTRQVALGQEKAKRAARQCRRNNDAKACKDT